METDTQNREGGPHSLRTEGILTRAAQKDHECIVPSETLVTARLILHGLDTNHLKCLQKQEIEPWLARIGRGEKKERKLVFVQGFGFAR